MSAFKFRLQTLLKTRQAHEKRCALELTKNEILYRATRERVRELEERRKRFASHLTEMQEAFPMREVQNTLIYLEGLDQRIEEGRNRLLTLHELILAHRQKVAEAVKERKVLESLRTRKLTDHRRTVERYTSQLMDALASRGIHWSKGENSVG